MFKPLHVWDVRVCDVRFHFYFVNLVQWILSALWSSTVLLLKMTVWPVYVTADGKSLNDQRMLRPVDRRCCRATEQFSVDSMSAPRVAPLPTTVPADLPPGLEQLLGENIANIAVHAVCRPACCLYTYLLVSLMLLQCVVYSFLLCHKNRVPCILESPWKYLNFFS